MLQRELILRELWSRMSSVSGVLYTARNPKAVPGVENMPAILLYELDDPVLSTAKRDYPHYARMLKVVLEMYIKGSSESAASSELGAFVLLVKKKLYAGGNTLGGLCVFEEVASSKVLRPAVGEPAIGIGITLDVSYLEDVAAEIA